MSAHLGPITKEYKSYADFVYGIMISIEDTEEDMAIYSDPRHVGHVKIAVRLQYRDLEMAINNACREFRSWIEDLVLRRSYLELVVDEDELSEMDFKSQLEWAQEYGEILERQQACEHDFKRLLNAQKELHASLERVATWTGGPDCLAMKWD